MISSRSLRHAPFLYGLFLLGSTTIAWALTSTPGWAQSQDQRFLGIPSGRMADVRNQPTRATPTHPAAKTARTVKTASTKAPLQETIVVEGDPAIDPMLGCAEAGCRPYGPLSCYSCFSQLNGRFYGGAELLAWWTDGMDVPALVTTNPVGTSSADIGVIGASGTTVLYGDDGIVAGSRLGGRFTLGYQLNPCSPWSIEATYTFLGTETDHFAATSADTPILARPFRNITTGALDAVQLSVPGELQGRFTVDSSTEFQSFELLTRRAIIGDCGVHVDLLLGYRYGELDDRLQINDSITTLVAFPPGTPVIPVDTTLAGTDLFVTDNQFSGAQIGFAYEMAHCGWTTELTTSVAFGTTSTDVFIDGTTAITLNGATTNASGSKLALPSNMDRYSDDSFAMIPEIGARLYYDISPCWRASVAYSLVYWSKVARAGNQIDLDLDENQFPLPNTTAGTGIWPEFQFDFDDFWAQGLSVGLERRF